MDHNSAVSLTGQCHCPCHILRSRVGVAACWCNERTPSPEDLDLSEEELDQARSQVERAGGWWDFPALHHNDAVNHFSACRCRCHTRRGECTCKTRTDPSLLPFLRRKEDQDLRRRLATGRARPEEYLRHAPHLLPGFRSR